MKTRYFILQDRDGSPAAVYRSEWAQGALVSENFWDTDSDSWQPSQVISKWNHFGDTEIEEISEVDFNKIFQSIKPAGSGD